MNETMEVNNILGKPSPSMWEFFQNAFLDHPWIFTFIAFMIIGLLGSKWTGAKSFIGFWLGLMIRKDQDFCIDEESLPERRNSDQKSQKEEEESDSWEEEDSD